MPRDLSSEKTTVVATFPMRRDAEMAVDRLEREDIEVLITADDAGSMHPQLQMVHGVKLVVLAPAADEARRVLNEAGVLPRQTSIDESRFDEAEDEPSADITFLQTGTLFKVGLGIVIAVLIFWTLFLGFL